MSPPQKFSVLVLDNLSAVSATLAASGFAVTEVPTGEEAMRLIRQRPFDLVLLDMNVPGWNSLEACRQVRAFAPSTKIIMIAPVDADEDRVRALEAGADDCVNRPLEFRELIARARAVLRLSSPQIIKPLEVTRPAGGKNSKKAR
jgi:DNA-binding response OmpR family regulator